VDELFRRQARELDRKKREALLHQMQRILHEQVVQASVYHLGFPIGVGPRVDEIMATAIPGFYMSPYEDLKLRR
jgi:ABC-type transport system substrate-binding protein